MQDVERAARSWHLQTLKWCKWPYVTRVSPNSQPCFFHKYAIQKEKNNTAQTLRLKPKAWSLTDRFVCLSKYPAFKERNATKASLLNPQIIKEITDAFEKISVSCLFVCQNHHQRTSFRHGHRSQSHAFQNIQRLNGARERVIVPAFNKCKSARDWKTQRCYNKEKL